MKIVIKPYDALPCSLSTFTINGVDADKVDFGETVSDGCPNDCEGYDCHNNHFEAGSIDASVLKKYKITRQEAKEIQERLENALRVGDCGWCV
jgi:hypothetical protein